MYMLETYVLDCIVLNFIASGDVMNINIASFSCMRPRV